MYTAGAMVRVYYDEAENIFSLSKCRDLITLCGACWPRYDRNNLDKMLETYLGETKLSETLTPFLCVSFSLDSAGPNLWMTVHGAVHDHYLRDVVGASSAAPTYFAAKEISIADNETMYEVDGALFANNPEVAASYWLYLKELKDRDVVMVSLGTGEEQAQVTPRNPNIRQIPKLVRKTKNAGVIGWAFSNPMDLILNAESKWSEWLANANFKSRFRFQVPLPRKLTRMDNAKANNMCALLKAADAYLEDPAVIKDIRTVCEIITPKEQAPQSD